MFSRTLKVPAALLAAGLMSLVMSAPVSGNVSEGISINLNVHNNSSTAVEAAYCPKGHVSIHYKFGTHHNPCSVTPFIHRMHAHGGAFLNYRANPVGVVVTAAGHHTLYFYVRNPSIGRPFFEVNGHKLTMVAGQVTHMAVAGGLVEFQRPGDRDGHKQMVINILRMGKS